MRLNIQQSCKAATRVECLTNLHIQTDLVPSAINLHGITKLLHDRLPDAAHRTSSLASICPNFS